MELAATWPGGERMTDKQHTQKKPDQRSDLAWLLATILALSIGFPLVAGTVLRYWW
jgi:hypothetical protein